MKKVFIMVLTVIILQNATAQDKWFMAQTNSIDIEWISASSELVEAQYGGDYLYPPINMLDGDFSTTWCEADKGGSGLGETITLQFKEPVSFDEIQIVNGFVSGNDYYKKNNRVATITLTQVAGEHFQNKQYTLRDNTPTWQSIRFGLNQTAQTITIRIDEVFRGYKYDDTCMSDIRFLYKGKVIPYVNVAAIKKAQEENSRMMLKTSASQFKQDFKALFGNKAFLYIRESGEDTGYRIDLDPNYDIDLIRMRFDSSKTAGYTALRIPGSDGSWYKLENYRIVEYSRIGYVTTERILVLKLDGTQGLYLGGVHYDILPYEKVADDRK
ncbi:MAG: nicotine adenine dinucleotide glycohydrolase [Spirochaetales bacterium]|nr:nicotine adenine dinucleotide glycohydrolase [Spirochaetales bacterium]